MSVNEDFANVDFTTALRSLTMKEIEQAVPPHTFRTVEKRSRSKLEEAAHCLSDCDRTSLTNAAASKRRRIQEDERDFVMHPESTSHAAFDSHFFETVPEERRQECISAFIDATGSQALSRISCAVCAGTFFSSDVQKMLVTDLREMNKLVPAKPHPSQVLTQAMLLHRGTHSFTTVSGIDSHANVCSSCASSLHNNVTPALSLANGMWIGDVPLVLRLLTLPERILVARYFPAAYIVKLYPMKKGARTWSIHGFHSGLRGNVSTYRLNTDDIVSMTDSQIMPPHSEILAATIGVTFVGPRNLPQKTMPGFLYVNRNRIHDALLWLKQNNPIYRDILISSDRLQKLPLNSVLSEIIVTTKHSDDSARLAEERDGYVPEDSDSDECLDDDDEWTDDGDVNMDPSSPDCGACVL